MTGAEVVVIGAGIVGASAARELAVRGVDVWLVERGEVASGTTGRGEGNVILADKEPGAELDLGILGQAMYDELDMRLGDGAGIRRKGCLVMYETEEARRAGARHVERMLARGVDARMVDAHQLREMEPQIAPDLAGAASFPRDLQVDAAAVARLLTEEARAAGARVTTARTVVRIVSDDHRIAGVETDAGHIAAGAVVLAAGAWSAALAESAGLRLPVVPRKGQLALTEPAPEVVRHKLLDGSYGASVTGDSATLAVSTVLEMASDGHLLVGSSRELRGFDTRPDAAVTTAIVDRARRFLPMLDSLRIERTWAGLRPYLPDHLPAIGRSARVPGLWVATGHEGAGIGLGPISGRLIAEAYCGEPAQIGLGPFDPDRFS